jgi:hypothetical protein
MAPETIHLLDFRRGAVAEIDERIPPRGWPAGEDQRLRPLPSGRGFVLASLGSPTTEREPPRWGPSMPWEL